LKNAAETVNDNTGKYVKRGKGIVNDVVDTASSAYSAARKVVPI